MIYVNIILFKFLLAMNFCFNIDIFYFDICVINRVKRKREKTYIYVDNILTSILYIRIVD